MKAYAHSVRIAPKKANLIAKMVRGMPVPDAVEALRTTHKKGARMIELLLRSAIANTSHSDKQDPQTMVISAIVVNQGQAYRRGMPMARGRQRPYRKFLSHITLELGFAGQEKVKKSVTAKGAEKMDKSKQDASQEVKNTVKSTSSLRRKKTQETQSSDSSSSSLPS